MASKGSLKEHQDLLLKIFNILESKNMTVKWERCSFFQKDIEWLGFKVSNTTVKPLVGKMDSIKNLNIPKNISESRSFFGSISQ